MISAIFNHGGGIVWVLFALSVAAVGIITARALTLLAYRRRLAGADFTTETDGTVDQVVTREALRLSRGLTTLRVIASAAPLLGLLGTVMGLFRAFQSVAAEGLGNPATFADGIALALTTTIAGLLVALPASAAHQYLSATVERLLLQIETRLLAAARAPKTHPVRRTGT